MSCSACVWGEWPGVKSVETGRGPGRGAREVTSKRRSVEGFGVRVARGPGGLAVAEAVAVAAPTLFWCLDPCGEEEGEWEV